MPEEKPEKLDYFDPVFIMMIIMAGLSDFSFIFMLGIVIPGVGLLFPVIILGAHYTVGLILIVIVFFRLKHLLSKAVLLAAITLPMPFLSAGIIIAIVLQNKLVEFLAVQAAIVAVGVATAGTGAVAGEAAALGAEGAAVGAEAAVAGAEAAAAGAEAAAVAGETAVAGAEAVGAGAEIAGAGAEVAGEAGATAGGAGISEGAGTGEKFAERGITKPTPKVEERPAEKTFKEKLKEKAKEKAKEKLEEVITREGEGEEENQNPQEIEVDDDTNEVNLRNGT